MTVEQTHAVFDKRARIKLPSFQEGAILLANGPASLAQTVICAQTCAPYLKDLLEKWPELIEGLAELSPEALFDELLRTINGNETEAVMAAARQAKQKIHLLLALCDLSGVWDWAEVTRKLSRFADQVMAVLIESIAEEMGIAPSARGPVPGLFILALGKYGAEELNYSSDIDLIVFYDPDHIVLPDPARAEKTLVRFVRRLMRGFDEITADGYVFRTDLRLRPDPRSNSVAVSTVTAERYYESLGQNWERAAMIKARYCGGDKAAADEFIKNVLTPFIWRRTLDYAAIADIHSIKRQIQGNATPEAISPPGHHLKLGIGGIREIEFYAQVQQLILGGRNKAIRTPRTLSALSALVGGGYVEADIADRLSADYALLRDLEHRVQMYADEQTHDWPHDEDHRKKLTAMAGHANLKAFETEMKLLFQRVHAAYTGLFPEEEDLSAAKGSLVFTGVEPEKPTLETLMAYGFERGPEVWRQMADWLGGRIPATRTPRARELLTRLAPRIIEACGETEIADTAFFNFAEFISNLNAGVTLLSFFVNQPAALNQLINMLAIARPLAPILAAQPSLLDAMVEPDFDDGAADTELSRYHMFSGRDVSFEDALNGVRRAVHEDQFKLMAGLLNARTDHNAGPAFTSVAQSAIKALLPPAGRETERLYGTLEGECAILGFGKLGGREMSYSSDIDIVLVYKPNEGAENASNQFNKLARRIVTALSAITEEGGLYEVDMALRPSGRAGPLAVNINTMQKYYAEDAWTWEFMALSRARVIAATSANFAKQLYNLCGEILQAKDFNGKLAADIKDMHERLSRDKPAKGEWDIKGMKGGLRDIEFIAQYLVLKHKPKLTSHATIGMLKVCKSRGWLDADDADFLIKSANLYHRLVQVLSIAVDGILEPSTASKPVLALLAKSAGHATFSELSDDCERRKLRVSKLLDRCLG